MEKSKHCELCDLQLTNLKEGKICSLTNKKPIFNRTCMKIKLDGKARERILQINEEFANLKYTKKHAFINLFFYSIIGFSVIYLSYFIGIKLLDKGVFSTVTLVIFVVGLTVLGMGIGPINYYFRDKNIIVPKKTTLDKIIELYNVTYDFDSKTSTNMMGEKETISTLSMSGKITISNKRH